MNLRLENIWGLVMLPGSADPNLELSLIIFNPSMAIHQVLAPLPVDPAPAIIIMGLLAEISINQPRLIEVVP